MQSYYGKLIAEADALDRIAMDEFQSAMPNATRYHRSRLRALRLREKARALTLKAANRRAIPAEAIMYSLIFVVTLGMCVSCIVTLLLK